MSKFIIPIIVVAVIVIGIGAFFVLQKPNLSKSQKQTSSKQINQINQDNQIAMNQMASAIDSPFGFLNAYIDNSRMKPVYSVYGGFSAIQSFYDDLGVHWNRMGKLSKPIIQKNGSYNWTELDEYVNIANKNSINSLITIAPGEDRYLPKDGDSYLNLIRGLLKRYSSNVKYYQIHNEVNGGVYWKDTPQNYAKLAIVTSDAIREICPDCKIILGSNINVDDQGSSKSIVPYFEPVLKELNKDGKKYFDVFDYHFFAPAEYALDSYYLALEEGIKETKNLLSKYGYGNAEIWITETMIFTTDGMSNAEIQKLPKAYQKISEKQQAKSLLKTYVFALSKDIKKIFWTSLTEGPWEGFMFKRAGLIRHPNFSGNDSKKLSYYTYKKMVEVLEGSDWNNIQTIQESDGVYIYKFIKHKRPMFVVWNDNKEERQITISMSSTDAIITKAIPKYDSGNEVKDYKTAFETETKEVKNGKINLILEDVPVFIQEQWRPD